MPGRVFFLFLDRVEAFGRFQPFLADRDGVGLGQLQVLPEAQREGRAVEGQVGRVLGGDLALGHLRLGRVDAGDDRARRVGVQHRGVRGPRSAGCRAACGRPRRRRLRASRRSASTSAFCGSRLISSATWRTKRLIAALASRSTCGEMLSLDLAAGHVADQAPREAAVLAVGDRFFDRLVDVGADLQLGAGQLPALAVEADPQRVAQRRQQSRCAPAPRLRLRRGRRRRRRRS